MGQFLGPVAPYGYMKDPQDNHHLVPDPYASEVVKRIYHLYLSGIGKAKIGVILTDGGVLVPTEYKQKVQKLNYRNAHIKEGQTPRWCFQTIDGILRDEVYIGNTVQHKKSVISYKVKKIRTVEKENQIRVDNTHEAIIDKDTFEKVQCIIEKRGTNTKLKYDYLLRGLLYCYHCKRKLQIVLKKNSKRNAKSHPYITCSGAKERGCYPLNMNYEKFEKHIIYVVKKICQIYADKEIFYSIY